VCAVRVQSQVRAAPAALVAQQPVVVLVEDTEAAVPVRLAHLHGVTLQRMVVSVVAAVVVSTGRSATASVDVGGVVHGARVDVRCAVIR